MTKQELLDQVDLAIVNNAYLLLKAGDYFTDYYKLIQPHTVKNFKIEVKKYGVEMYDDIAFDGSVVKLNSVDAESCGCMTGELNQYFVYESSPVLPEEVEPLLSYLD